MDIIKKSEIPIINEYIKICVPRNTYSGGAMKKIFMIMLTLLVVGCSNKNDIEIEFKDQPIQFEYGELIAVTDLIIWGNQDSAVILEINDQEIGNQSVRIKAVKGLEVKVMEVDINIVDTKAPKFIKSETAITLNQGETLDINKYFEATDDVDGSVEISLNEPVDTEISGTHSRFVIAADKNGNISQVSVFIKIESKKSEVIPPSSSQSLSPQDNFIPKPNIEIPQEQKPSTSKPTPSVKRFAFDEYNGDSNATFNACMVYVQLNTPANVAGMCIPYTDNKVNIGYIAQFQ